MKHLQGSSLPTVMVISILISLLILFAIALFDINHIFYSVYHNVKQSKEDINSAFVLYCNDSTFLDVFEKEQGYALYEDKPSSTVQLQVKPWGFYECVMVSAADKELSSFRILGKTQECNNEAALWVCSRDMILTLAGNTEVNGKVFIPINGVSYAQLGGVPFQGKELDDDHIDLSKKELPLIDSLYLRMIDKLYDEEDVSFLPSQQEIKPYYSFEEKTSHFLLPKMTDFQIRGNVVLYTDEIVLTHESKLSDVILVARKVILDEGFSGSLQIIAQDTVLIKDNVQLQYPSGIYLRGNQGQTYLGLGKHSKLDGYAIVLGNTEHNYGLSVEHNYSQDSTATFNGLLYVDGIADIRGELSGALYLKESYYFPENGIYAGTINDAKISRGNQIAYPFLFSEASYQRKVIKTVH